MNTCRFIPIIALVPLVLAAITALALRLSKRAREKYSTYVKIEFSYLAVAALLSALLLFALGFFVSSDTLNILPIIIFSTIMLVRTAFGVIFPRKRNSENNSEL